MRCSGRIGTEGYVDRGLDPAGALCEMPEAPAALILRVACKGGGWVVGVKIVIFFSDMDDSQESIGN